MLFLILIGQRKERYEGEYAPEVLAAIDEHGDYENPDFMRDAHQTAKGSDEFENAVVVRVEVPDAAITKILRPTLQTIAGRVLDGE